MNNSEESLPKPAEVTVEVSKPGGGKWDVLKSLGRLIGHRQEARLAIPPKNQRKKQSCKRRRKNVKVI